MKAPICKICGKSHWERICASSSKLPVQDVPTSESIPVPQIQKLTAPRSTPSVSTADDLKTESPSAKFDRVAYQREYMRKRRVEQRRQKEKQSTK